MEAILAGIAANKGLARNEQLLRTARIPLSVAISGAVETDFEELNRVADCGDYRVGDELRELLREVAQKGSSKP